MNRPLQTDIKLTQPIFNVYPISCHLLKSILTFTRDFIKGCDTAHQNPIVNLLYGKDEGNYLAEYERYCASPNSRCVHVADMEQVYRLFAASNPRYIIIHGQFLGSGFWRRMLLKPQIWRRVILIYWGSDLEALTSTVGFQRRSRGIYRYILYILKGYMLRHFGLIGVLMPQEVVVLKKCFPELNNVFRMAYPWEDSMPGRYGEEAGQSLAPGGHYTVVCGNSGYPNNNHIELIDFAKKIDNGATEWVFPLTYGRREHITLTCGYGTCILGKAFVPLRENMPYSEYVKMFAGIHALVFNHTFETRSQQGLGNLCIAMSFGKKIYIRSDNALYKQLRDWGASINDTFEIVQGQSASFYSPMAEPDAERNRSVLRNHFSKEAALKLWKAAFEARRM
jgi:hypothetical protein